MEEIQQKMYSWAEDLFPINRSITGEGVRKTLKYIKNIIPELNINEIPTGTDVFDWKIPNEWNITEAFIEDEKGNRIIDFEDSNLHVVGYSIPVDKWIDLEELDNHLYTIKSQPHSIPYVKA